MSAPGISPISVIDTVHKSTAITAITGSLDSNTFSSLAESYVKKAKKNGLQARFIPIPNGKHNNTRWKPEFQEFFITTILDDQQHASN
mgnify:CR=1 FL=1